MENDNTSRLAAENAELRKAFEAERETLNALMQNDRAIRDQALAKVAELKARCKVLEDALRPFAKESATEFRDYDQVLMLCKTPLTAGTTFNVSYGTQDWTVTIGHLRAARKALE